MRQCSRVHQISSISKGKVSLYNTFHDHDLYQIFYHTDPNTVIHTMMKMGEANYCMATADRIYINTRHIHRWREYIKQL